MKKRFSWITSRSAVAMAVSLAALHALAFKVPTLAPLPNFDQRQMLKKGAAILAPEQAGALDALRNRVPEIQVTVDSTLRTPRLIQSKDGFLTGPDGIGGGTTAAGFAGLADNDTHRVVKAFVNENSTLFGHDATALDAATIRQDYRDAHNGMRTIVWEQRLDSIPVLDRLFTAHVTARGELINISSQFVPDLGAAADAVNPNRAALISAPPLTAAQAVAAAAQFIGESVAPAGVVAKGPPAGPQLHQSLTVPGLPGATDVRLVWVPMTRAALRLCWDVILTSGQRGEMFRVIVDAQTGALVIRRNLTAYLSDASYRVYTSDSPSPFSPGLNVPGTFQPPLISRDLVVTNAISTNASPNGWINDGDNETLGNNVDAHLDVNKDDQPDLPRPVGSPTRVFDFPLDLTQDPSAYGDAAVVQLFYLNNLAHDRLYDLGFTEAAGNFQTDNFGRGGQTNDAVQADAQDGSGTDNANFATPPDGIAGRMQMYIFSSPVPRRDGDLDAEVVLHEYGHGLSTRLVGGGVGIFELQTAGMGEGWSDFYALCLLSESGDSVTANYAAGGYVTYLLGGMTQNYYYGIRRYPYSTTMTKNPLTFKDIDPGQISRHTGIPISPIFTAGADADEVHNQGEVWCVTLWDVRANLVNKYGLAAGNRLAMQLVMDGMKLAPANPNFLESRDSIILADKVLTGGANFNELWAGFAKRGMGGSATSPGSDTTSGVTEAFDLPGLAFNGVVVADQATGNGNSVIDFNECVDLTIKLLNNGNATASGVSAILSTATPGVVVLQPYATYPNVAPGGSAANFLGYKVFTTPAFVCGTRIQFVLQISSSQGVRTTKFNVDTGVVGQPSRYDNFTPVIIPDANPTGIESTVSVSGFNSPIGRVTVALHLTHTYDADMRIQLIAPDGTRIFLADGNGFNGTNFGINCSPDTDRTTFDDKAPASIASGRAPFVGSYRPVQPLDNFRGKSGSAVNGTWRLKLIDQGLADIGTLQCWSLSISPVICTPGSGSCASDLAVTGSVSTNQIPAGASVSFRVAVTNRSPNTALSVTVADTLPPGFAFLSASTSSGSFSRTGQQVTAALGDLVGGSGATLTIVGIPSVVGFMTNTATATASITDINPADNSIATVLNVTIPAPAIVPAGARLLSESFAPPSGGVDGGELVTINFLLQNVGSAPTTNLVATLLPGNGVLSPTGPQSYGALAVSGPPQGRSFSFTADGTNRNVVQAILQLQDGPNSLGQIAFSFGLGGTTNALSPSVITIPENGASAPYPAPIGITGLPGLISRLTVTVSNLNHTFPDDVDILLVGPTGQSVVLLSDAGGGVPISSVTLTLDDQAVAKIPDESQIISGTFKPTDYEPGDVWPAPAPAGPRGNGLAAFNGTNPNGLWSLYITDDSLGDAGRIANGWSLRITTADIINPVADVVVGATTPVPALIGSNLVFAFVATNSGPSAATSVILTNTIPAGTTLVSFTNSQGAVQILGNQLIATIPSLTNQGSAQFVITVQPSAIGSYTNSVTISANEIDLNLTNNTASAIGLVNPAADLSLSVAIAPQPVEAAKNLTATFTVTNRGPNTATGVTFTNPLPAGATFVSVTPSQGSAAQNAGTVTAALGSLSTGATATVTVVLTLPTVGSVNLAASVAAAVIDLVGTNNSVAAAINVVNPSLVFVGGGARLLAEGNLPRNGGLDPGEVVTVQFALRNIGVVSSTNLTATLRATGGVTAPSGPQNYGAVATNAAAARPFTFTASGSANGVVTATLDLADGSLSLGSLTFNFGLGGTASFGTVQPLNFPDSGLAAVYPSTIPVSGRTGLVSKVTVTLNGLTHSFPDDLDILLVGPAGQKVMLMSDAGGGASLAGVNITFDDAAVSLLPDSTQIVSGTFRPTDYEPGDSLPLPAPAGPYSTSLFSLIGTTPNGNWSLYVVDDTTGDAGRLNGGWTLNITTSDVLNSVADLGVGLSASPTPIAAGSVLTYTMSVSNRGPFVATNIFLTNIFPAGAAYSSATTSQGSYQPSAGFIVFNLGSLSSGGAVTSTVKVIPSAGGSALDSAVAVADQFDPVAVDNSISLLTSVISTASTVLGPVSIVSQQVHFSVTGEPSRSFVIETAPTLSAPISWSPVLTNVIPATGRTNFIDTSALGSARFYRARLLP